MSALDDLSALRGYWDFAYRITDYPGWKATPLSREPMVDITASSADELLCLIADHYYRRGAFGPGA